MTFKPTSLMIAGLMMVLPLSALAGVDDEHEAIMATSMRGHAALESARQTGDDLKAACEAYRAAIEPLRGAVEAERALSRRLDSRDPNLADLRAHLEAMASADTESLHEAEAGARRTCR